MLKNLQYQCQALNVYYVTTEFFFYRWNTSTIHIVYTKTYFENCLWFVSYGSFSQLSSRWPGQASLRDKLWRETIFKNMAGWINVSICSVIISIGQLIEEKKSFVRTLYKTTGAAFKTHFVILFSQSCRKRARKSKEVFQITSSMTDLSWIVLPKELFHQLYLNGTLIMNRWVQYTTIYKCQFYFDLPLFVKYVFP